MTKAAARREALDRWWRRGPWPCLILAVDPGRVSGYAQIRSGPGGLVLQDVGSVEIHRGPVAGRALESVVKRAFEAAGREGLTLIAALEDWGRGGPRGLAQWIGLGEARGPWRREILLRGQDAAQARSRVVLVTQSRWRSRVVPETGATTPDGRWRPFEPEEWKGAARRAAMDLFLDAHVPEEDAAEAACIGAYAARSDQVLRALTRRELDAAGVPAGDRDFLEPAITGSKA